MKAARVIGMGVGGLVVAAALSLGAFAIAGGSIGEPARPVSVPSGSETSSNTLQRTPPPSPSPERSDDHGDASHETTTSSASPSEDGRGGTSGSGDHDGDD